MHTHTHTYIHTCMHACIHTYNVIPFHSIPFHCITYILTLHYITLHYVTLHYIKLHYITFIHTYIYMYVHRGFPRYTLYTPMQNINIYRIWICRICLICKTYQKKHPIHKHSCFPFRASTWHHPWILWDLDAPFRWFFPVPQAKVAACPSSHPNNCLKWPRQFKYIIPVNIILLKSRTHMQRYLL